LLVELGRSDEAHLLADGKEEQLSLPSLQGCSDTKPHRFIPLPLVAQNKNQCVPTSVAMTAYPQGRVLDPGKLFVEMKGRDGTALWRMRKWLHSNGFRLVPICLEQTAIVALLDQGIPLMGVLENPFNSHVEVICGYNQAIDVFYIRDPMHWIPGAFPSEMTFQRYELYGAVLAIIDENATSIIEVAENFQNEECSALIDLDQAVAEGKRQAADAAYARISDDSPAAFIRDRFAYCVAISPATFNTRMQLYAKSEDANSVSRFRALMTLGSHDAQEVLEQFFDQEASKLGPAGRRYLKLLSCMNNGQWAESRKLVERLLLFGSSVSNFWELKAEILAELGDQSGSQEAFDLAIELDPHRMSLREKSLNRSATHLTFAEYVDEFETLLENEPDNKSLLWGKAIALLDGPDGKNFERVTQEYLHWFPRDPRGYSELINWYHQQGRKDLADALIATGNALLDNLFAEPEHDPASPSQEPADSPLPADKEQLLTIFGTSNHPQKSAALEQLLQYEADGQLLWHERSQLLAMRLTADVESSAIGEVDARALLPCPTPGAAHWFANHVTELVEQNSPTIRIALDVVEWIEQVVPDFRKFPGLWFNRLLLIEKTQRIEQATEELQQFLKQYPVYSSALYRMGVVKHEQNNYQESIEYFEKSLHINPGLYGAMYMLRIVHETLGDIPASRAAIALLRKKLPYDFGFLRDEVIAAVEQDPPNTPEDLLREFAKDFCSERIAVLRAQLKINGHDLEAANELLSSLEIADASSDELHEDFLQTRLNLATMQQSSPKILELCDEGLQRWPDSTRLKELKAEHLAASDLSGSLLLLEEVLCEGEPGTQTAYQYLLAAKKPADTVAKYAINKASEERRMALAEIFAEVMGHSTLLQFNAPFLQWAVKTFPDSDNLRYRLAIHHNINGQAKQAIKVARQLYDRNPDHPDAAKMLGRCLLDKKPQEALPYLEKACEQNRSSDNLFDLARGYHMAGQRSRAVDIHWEVLKLNPYTSASLANLHILGAGHSKLWPLVNPMLELGCGVEDEYFLVATVILAKKANQLVSSQWIHIAAQRWEILKTRPGFEDERTRLKKSIAAWLEVRPQDGQDYRDLPSGFFTRLESRFFWPRYTWVPAP